MTYGVGNGLFKQPKPSASARIDAHDRHTHLPFQCDSIYSDALAPRNVAHSKGNNNRYPQVHDLRAEEEVAFQVARIGYDNNEVGPVAAVAIQQYLVGDLFVSTFRIEAVSAWQVKNMCREAFVDVRSTCLLIHRHAGEVAY